MSHPADNNVRQPVSKILPPLRVRVRDRLFWWHSWLTTVILAVASILTTNTFVGFLGIDIPAIDCVFGYAKKKEMKKMLDTYCWTHSTFTLPNSSIQAHPGVGPYGDGDNIVVTHKYYQWVCFILAIQAVCFYAPRAIWKVLEDGKMYSFIPPRIQMLPKKKDEFEELKERLEKQNENGTFSLPGMDLEIIPRFFIGQYISINSEEFEDIVAGMKEGFRMNSKRGAFRKYLFCYLFCQMLCIVNTVLQIIFIDYFLDHAFFAYGFELTAFLLQPAEERTDPMNYIFPKVGKCTFRKMGHSGTVQTFDGICLLPINVVSEKIYVILLFWLIILLVIICFLFFRLLGPLLSKRAREIKLRKMINKNGVIMNESIVKVVADKMPTSDWFFLFQAGKNVDPYILARVVNAIYKEHFD